MAKEEQKVKKDMFLGEIVQKYPKSAIVMMKYGLHCIGCHVSAYETLEQGCKAHGMTYEQIEEMLKEVNKAAEEE